MFSRAVRPAVAVARNAQQQQGMATLREIEQRLKSVKNIEKITKVRLTVFDGDTAVLCCRLSG